MKIFDSVKVNTPKRNKFDLSHERKLSMGMGDLIPIMVQDVIPGDKFRVNSEVFMRFQPLLSPMMHRVNCYVHYFFVPNRIIWNEWEDFITGGVEGTSAPQMPSMSYNATLGGLGSALFTPGTLADYMGLPTIEAGDFPVATAAAFSALPFRAYQTIYNEFYRDQTLNEKVDFDLESGDVDNTQAARLLTMRKRAWEKDYFTSALPFAQRGAEVLLPVSVRVDQVRVKATDTVPVTGIGDPISYDNTGQVILNPDSAPIEGYIQGDNASSTINDFRRAYALQRWMEKAATVGSRYVEQLKGFFGVTSSDARLQRPEYLGGGMSRVQISEVLQSVQQVDSEGSPIGEALGTMGGHAFAAGNMNGFQRYFEEHGYVIGIMSVIPKTAYQQGLPRHFQKFDKYDFFWPELAHIGEQSIYDWELYYQGQANGPIPFGYQSRYAEYKYQPSTVHGAFKDTLAYWHMGRIFDAPPDLNGDFVTSDPTDRIFAVPQTANQNLLVQVYHKVDALRPMPYFGTPAL